MALTWSDRRQLTIFAIFTAAILLVLYFFISPYLKTQATCFDKKQNGSETGIDCGGSSCALVCPADARSIVVRWARALPVNSNIYNAIALVENQNIGAGVNSVSYEFKFYDEKNVLVTSRKGSSFIGPTGQFIIFEPRIDAGNRPIKNTLFAFTQAPTWLKVDKRLATFPIFAKDIKLSNPLNEPKIEASIINDSIYDIGNLDVIAVVYDKDGNAMAASKTYLDVLPRNSKSSVFFTWPVSFTDLPAKIDIIPNINPFKIKL